MAVLAISAGTALGPAEAAAPDPTERCCRDLRTPGSGYAVDLEGWTISDLGNDSFTIEGSLPMAAGGRIVLGRSTDAAGGGVDYVYGGSMTLANSADAIIIAFEGKMVDMVAHDAGFPFAAGRSLELDDSWLGPEDNDAVAAWCPALPSMATGNYGSPGTGPAPCP